MLTQTTAFYEVHTPAGLAYSRLVLQMLRVASDLTVAGDTLARDFGLSAARWLVMGAIRDGAKTISEIARERGLARQSVQETVNDMARQKLVVLVRSAEDGRSKLVRLTPRGLAMFTALTERWAERANRVARGFSRAELATAADIVSRIGADIEKLVGP
ncbi:MAG TPA: MarR family winged helix-turn-helix transcriptional regulator [Stellaceae bacterium]|jgi:DNA-binding MarR family transcriptional regulator|nr:MarR family winged helix-turn-helix transcriptional regulator [Stellaceae bacterium]